MSASEGRGCAGAIAPRSGKPGGGGGGGGVAGGAPAELMMARGPPTPIHAPARAGPIVLPGGDFPLFATLLCQVAPSSS
jgi:hypothetical protein